MRKVLLIISFLALLFISADDGPYQLVRLIVINRSGLPVEIQLTGLTSEEGPSGVETVHSYYLHIPKGDRTLPTERSFTIVPDYYKVQPYYIELWDPVYGSTCSPMGTKTLDITRRKPLTIYITPCNRRIPQSPGMIKFGSTAILNVEK